MDSPAIGCYELSLMTQRSSKMSDALLQRFDGAKVQVVDLTGTNDHFEVRISAPELKGLSRVQQHQRVMQVFADELKTGEVHALAIKVE